MKGVASTGLPAGEAECRAEAALKRVGLAALAERHPYDLSPSQRKLVAVLSVQTPVVVLDEPTTGQDYAGSALMGSIVDELRAGGRTVIAVAHDIDFCAEHLQRIIVMGEGRVLLDGPARSVLAAEDILAQTNVEPPQLVQLAKAVGLETGTVPLTVEEFIDAWARQRR